MNIVEIMSKYANMATELFRAYPYYLSVVAMNESGAEESVKDDWFIWNLELLISAKIDGNALHAFLCPKFDSMFNGSDDTSKILRSRYGVYVGIITGDFLGAWEHFRYFNPGAPAGIPQAINDMNEIFADINWDDAESVLGALKIIKG